MSWWWKHPLKELQLSSAEKNLNWVAFPQTQGEHANSTQKGTCLTCSFRSFFQWGNTANHNIACSFCWLYDCTVKYITLKRLNVHSLTVGLVSSFHIKRLIFAIMPLAATLLLRILQNSQRLFSNEGWEITSLICIQSTLPSFGFSFGR